MECAGLDCSLRAVIMFHHYTCCDEISERPWTHAMLSYLILDTLPCEYDSRVKAMEVDEKPTEDYNDVGGLGKEMNELKEAIVLPIMEPQLFTEIGIKPPKGMIAPPLAVLCCAVLCCAVLCCACDCDQRECTCGSLLSSMLCPHVPAQVC